MEDFTIERVTQLSTDSFLNGFVVLIRLRVVDLSGFDHDFLSSGLEVFHVIVCRVFI